MFIFLFLFLFFFLFIKIKIKISLKILLINKDVALRDFKLKSSDKELAMKLAIESIRELNAKVL